MKLHELKATEGARFTSKRIGRGQGSGLGKTSGKFLIIFLMLPHIFLVWGR